MEEDPAEQIAVSVEVKLQAGQGEAKAKDKTTHETSTILVNSSPRDFHPDSYDMIYQEKLMAKYLPQLLGQSSCLSCHPKFSPRPTSSAEEDEFVRYYGDR
jgi:hypothetical protein